VRIGRQEEFLMTARSRSVLPALAVCLAFTSIAAAQAAPAPALPAATARQAAPARPQPARTLPEPGQRTRIVTESQDAQATRQQLHEMLRRYSPSLGGVLKLDPSLLNDANYLAPYPELADLLSRHPEIARDPGYFFEEVNLPWADRHEPTDARMEVIRWWRDTVQASIFFVVFLVIVATLLWLIKTLVDYRRWSRLSKVQAEVHNKVLDRFGNNEELLAYVQTPAGRRFLESAPIMLDSAAPAVAAPLRRILWSIEAGCVLMAGGAGMQFVSGRSPQEVAPMIFGIGVLGMAIGVGFVVAAGVSFLISKRMGLLDGQSAPGPVA
jgi:hypothetical protein